MVGRLARRTVLAAALVVAAACGTPERPATAPPGTSDATTALAELAPPAGAPLAESPGRLESRTFTSEALGRTMPYLVWLPPGYDSGGDRRYPALYLLHGMGGSDRQWVDVGVVAAADRLVRAGTIAPLVIVMPEGSTEYWVDHANGGPRWGAYTAVDLVREVGASYRVLDGPAHRAIAGLSMGAHGAIQLALNYPDTFGVVGAHSLVLRRFGSAPVYFGNKAQYAQRDPMQLVTAKLARVRTLRLWIDIGGSDPWAPLARQFDTELTDIGVAHDWHEWPGDHSGLYWAAHLDDYLRFYDRGLGAATASAAVALAAAR